MRRDERERIAAVRDEEMTALRRQRDTAEAGIAHLEKRIVYLEGRAEKAEAALARARTLAGAMLHEAYCAGHPDAGRWRAEYAALDSPETPR
ncbi:hypothetical protein ACFQVD_26675 [Streptosporangium amethystogenes subsp. fukuiense]|uniref:Uncharacterized protein n=1 Tax=Streptosporangium amethystogenes subsp. fukuiense TaxID=698418 RepID=A0ABW2T5Q1_9ACTN